jgi:carboxyl-terminal processing protease
MYDQSVVVSSPPSVHEKRGFLGIGLALLLAAAAFFSGLHLGSGGPQNGNLEAGVLSALFAAPSTLPEEGVDLGPFWRVWNLLEEKYVDTGEVALSPEERIQGAISGLVDSYGDPYTVFMPPEESAAFEESISGNFSGVGMEVGVRDGVITVIAPLPDTPAERAGILPMDVLVAINGTSTERMNVDEAVKLIRGEAGTTVTLTIFREGENEFRDVSVTREVITIPTSKTEVRGDVFVISLYNFNALAESQMQDALREFVASGKRKLVLDLRGNPGGYLQSATAIASYFLPTGKVIVREQFGDGKEEVLYRSQGRVLHSFAPTDMVVLIDEGSASASEILAGALEEHEVATLIGQPTFGKGSVQELISLPDGSSVKITIARWFTPNGRSISDGGLSPSVLIDRTPEDRLENKDPQLDAALAWLAGKRDFPVATSTASTTTE